MHPILTLVLFNMLFSLYHVPVVHDYVMTHFLIHQTLLFRTSYHLLYDVVADCLSCTGMESANGSKENGLYFR